VLQGWIDGGKNLYVMLPYLRAYMGHQSFSDTVYYIHLLPDRLMKSPGIDWEKIDRVGLEADLWLD
ncbi:tyrosine-type recombinase/integrase, partial [Blautia sp. HCP3S3_B11]